jgi:separase
MPMGTPGKKVDHRQSTRHRIQVILEQADAAYQSALELVAGSGKVEDVRQACLSLALLRAFQTSLGQGGARVTSFAADLLGESFSWVEKMVLMGSI